MADFNKLKDTIRGAIYPNGRGAISADKHQAALLDMADTMQETAAQVTELSVVINGGSSNVEITDFPYKDQFLLGADLLSSGGYNVTDYIPIKDANKIVLENMWASSTGVCAYSIYGESKNYLVSNPTPSESALYNATLRKEDLPSGAAFIRCTQYVPSLEEIKVSKVVLSSSVGAGIAQNVDSLMSSVAQMSADLRNVQEDVSDVEGVLYGSAETTSYDKSAFSRKGFITEGGFVDNLSYDSTELINVKDATRIIITDAYSNQYGVLAYAFYADDGATIVGSNPLPTDGMWLNYTLTDIPSNAMYIVCCRSNGEDKPSKVVVEKKGDGLISEVQQIKNELNKDVEKDSILTYRHLEDNDIEYSNDGYSLVGNSIVKSSASKRSIIYFKDNIKAIEFEIGELLDANALTVILGIGKDGNSRECVAASWLPSNLRTEISADVQNFSINESISVSNEQVLSICGLGRMSSPYRNPENLIGKYGKGDICRIEILDKFILGSIKTENGWKKWFSCDTTGEWTGGSSRYGWNQSIRIGFLTRFASANAGTIIKNIKVINDSNDGFLEFCYQAERDFRSRGKVVAIGDSITEINNNNGLSYVGFLTRLFGYNIINKGRGGWTIYRMWRDRASVGWESAVSALPKDGIVTILMGTNDFDTFSFANVGSDVEMDSISDPHPRFGTTEADAIDAHDAHTTLGCLRLIIERIYQLNPSAKVVVFAPFYRTKKDVENGQFTEMLVNADGKTIYDYADAIVKVASEYNVPTFNTCRECGINKFTLETYTCDNLHINEQGGELIGKYVGSRLANL
jgi:hypothetical protein